MMYEVIINNFQKGTKLRTTPTDKIVKMEKIDERHHKVVYDLASAKEKEFVEKVLAKRLKEI